MARFVRHEPCPSCGSRDNLGRYDDGSAYCFGCGHTEKRTTLALHETSGEQLPALGPLSTTFGPDAVQWFRQYDLDVGEVLSRNVRWKERNQQVIFKFYNQEGEWVFAQARNFHPYLKNKQKSHNYGSKEAAFSLYRARSSMYSPKVVVVEDPLSAIKIARQTDCYTCLGVHLPLSKIIALKALGYGSMVIWLDKDKWREGLNIAERCQWVGMSCKAIYTETDPKTFSDHMIAQKCDLTD